jgi:two-component system, OmpR family, response regulator
VQAPNPQAVLLVEDDSTLREVVAELLRLEGYAVEEAQDGAEGVRALEEHQPPPDYYCGVLLDMMLPQVSGLEVLQRLRGEWGGYVPVVAMSASNLALEVAREAGAVATLPKPFDVERLLALVQQYCSYQAQ